MDQQFRAALGAMFGPDAAQQQAANLWLNDFAKMPDAWGCALAILEPTSGATLEQAFFAANMLASKTRSEWGRLSPQQRSELSDAFASKLRGLLLSGTPSAAAAVPVVLVDRLALLAASAAALGGAATAERHLALAQELAEAARAAGGADRAGSEALLRCSLLALQLLAEEAEGLDSGRRQALVAPRGGGAEGASAGLAARRGSVVAMAREVLAAASAASADGGPSFPQLLAAVRCLAAWVRLEDSGCSGCGVSPGELEALSPGLTPALLGLLALSPPGPPTSSPLAALPAARQQQQPTVTLYQAVADLVVDLIGPGGRTAAAAAGGEAADVAATAAAVDVLIPLGRQLAAAATAEAAAESSAAGGGRGSGAALSALLAGVRVAVAVSERNSGGLATGPGEGAVELAKTVVAALAACPGRREVCEASSDYFLALNTVPTRERHPALGAPLYGALLPYVLHSVSYPPGFKDWESEVEDDEEAFHRFREQQAADLLESMYGQCRTSMVAQLVAEATTSNCSDGATVAAAAAAGHRSPGGLPPPPSGGGSSNDWRRVEAALFCLRAVHLPVKAAALGGRAGELDSAAAAAVAADLQGLLLRLFNDICSPSGRVAGLLSVPWVCLAVTRLIAEYASWLGKGPEAPLQASLGLLLQALAVQPAAAASAQAFRNCCVRGAERLSAQPPTLAALAAAAMAVVAPAPPAGGGAAAGVALGLEERSAVVEGLARLVAGLPVEAAAEAGCSLMEPCVARAQSIAAAAAAAGGPLSPATLAALSAELGLMTAVVRFLEFPSLALGPRHGGLQGQAPDHPALRVLQVAWPVLSGVAGEPQCQSDPGVVEALADLYKRSLLSTKLAGRPLLPPLISAMLGVLRVRPHAAVLDTLSTVVELFGEVAHSEESRALQVTALEGAMQMMASLMAHLQQQQAPSTPPAAAGASGTPASPAAPSPAAPVPFPASSAPGELAAAFLSLADRFLLFARELLLTHGSGALPAIIEWACGVLRTMREREPAAAALAFLGHLLAAATTIAAEGAGGADAADAAAQAALRARMDELMFRCGPGLVHSMLAAGADTCPRQLMRPLAGCLQGLTALADAGAASGGSRSGDSALRSGLPGWLRAAWQLPPLAGLAHSGRLGEGAAHAVRFTELLLRGHYPPAGAPAGTPAGAALPRGRLDCLVTDFFSLARGEAAEDVMLAYEL